MLKTGRSLRARLWLIASCAALALALPTCKSKEKANANARAAASAEKPKGIPISLKLTAAERKKAAELRKRVKRGRFPKQLVEQRSNAKLFLYLAATETNRDVVLASLRAMNSAFGTSKSRRKPPRADEDYSLVVTTYLASENLEILGAAIPASRPIIQGPKPYRAAVDALVSIAESHPQASARIEALGALEKVQNYWKNDAIVGATLRALDHKSSTLVVSALQMATRQAAKGLERKNDFKARANRLLTNRKDVVHALAALLAVRLGRDPALLDRIVPLLTSKVPFARATAVRALAELGDTRAIHAIIPLVEDTAVEQYRFSYRSLTRRRAVKRIGSRRKTVQDRTLDALMRLSSTMDLKFQPKPTNEKDVEKARKATATAAKAWYARIKRKLPKYEPPAVPEKPTAKPDQRGKAPKQPAVPAAPPAAPANP